MGISAGAAKEKNLVGEELGLEGEGVRGRTAKRKLASGVSRFVHASRRGGATPKRWIAVEKSSFSRGRGVPTWFITVTQDAGSTQRTTTIGYDTNGWMASITDPMSRVTTFEHDLAGRTTKHTLPGNREVLFSYDGNGNLTSLAPPGRTAHLFGYTPVNLEETYTPPDLGFGSTATSYEYNKDRQLKKITRPDGLTIEYAFDTAGRISTVTTPTGTTTFMYSPTTGRLSSITAPGGVGLSYTWDGSLLKNTTWSGPVAGTVSRTYNTDFDVSTLTVAGNSVSLTRDSDRLLTGAGALTITRDLTSGFITGTTLGAVTTSRGYGSFGELASTSASAGSTALYSTSFTRDALGRIAHLDETIEGASSSTVYDYDTAGRLWKVTVDGVLAAEYLYDQNGNRTSVSNDLGLETTATYDAQDRLLTYGGASYTYTKNGELLTKTDASGTTTYSYDVLGNLRTLVLPDGRTIEYLIDGQNRRVGKKVNGTLVQGFLWEDQLRVSAELDGSGAVVSRLVYGEGVNSPEHMVRGGVTYRIVTDHLGSPRLVIDTTSGVVAQRMDYDEWGRVLLDTNPGFQPFGFAGGLYDRDTRLVRFGTRDYDADVGRWTAKDQMDFRGGDANLYGYLLGDPMNLADPDGRVVPAAVIGFCAANPGTCLHAAYAIGEAIVYGVSCAVNYFSKRKADIREIDRVAKKWNLSPAQRRMLHDEITGQNLSPDEIDKIAEDIAKHNSTK